MYCAAALIACGIRRSTWTCSTDASRPWPRGTGTWSGSGAWCSGAAVLVLLTREGPKKEFHAIERAAIKSSFEKQRLAAERDRRKRAAKADKRRRASEG